MVRVVPLTTTSKAPLDSPGLTMLGRPVTTRDCPPLREIFVMEEVSSRQMSPNSGCEVHGPWLSEGAPDSAT